MQSYGETIGMNITVHEGDGILSAPSLLEGIRRLYPLTFSTMETITIALIGAGGKTTCLYALARELKACHKKILIMTTTHMYEPDESIFSGMDEEKTAALLDTSGIAAIGKRCGNGKITYVGDDVYERMKRKADIILVEADGSRRLPIKVCGAHEPVLPQPCHLILALAGLSALGKELKDVCFRADEADVLLSAEDRFEAYRETNIVDMDVFTALFRQGVIKKVSPLSIPIIPVLNQADTVAKRIAADMMLQDLGLWGLSTSFLSKEDR